MFSLLGGESWHADMNIIAELYLRMHKIESPGSPDRLVLSDRMSSIWQNLCRLSPCARLSCRPMNAVK